MDIVEEIVEIQNSQLSSEEKSMLLSSYSAETILLARLRTTSLISYNALDVVVQPKEVKDAISYDQKVESPSQQPQAKDENAPPPCPSPSPSPPPPGNSSAITTSQEELQGKNNDSEEKMKGDRDNSIALEETLSSKEIQNEQKEKEAEVNLKETLASKGTNKDIVPPQNDTSNTPPETDIEEVELARDINASAQVVPSESRRFLLAQGEHYKVEEFDNNSNEPLHSQDIINASGKDDESIIHKHKAACRHCNILITQDSRVSSIKCKCTKISLVHEDCMGAWSQENENNCSNCDQPIQTVKVKVSLIPQQTSRGNCETPTVSTCVRSWCCLW